MYETFAETHLTIGTRSGNEVMVRCPYHESHSYTLQFNIVSGLWLCFSCGASGNAKTLIHDVGGRWIDNGENVSDLKAKLNELNTQAGIIPKRTHLDESILNRYRFPSPYWTERGLTDVTIKAFDLGYDPIENFVTIPVRNMNGELIGIIKRFLDEDALVRYRYPTVRQGFHKSQHLFASWLVANDDREHVVLVEGSIDAMKVWQAGYPALAILGSSVSTYQFLMLRKLGITKVTTFFDNDAAGRKATLGAYGYKVHVRHGKRIQEYDIKSDLRREFVVNTASYRRMPKDPGACNTRQIKMALANASQPAID